MVPGTFPPFHNAWIVQLQATLNNGVLPPDYYALSHQPATDVGPDILTLRYDAGGPDGSDNGVGGIGTLSVAECPPQTAIQGQIDPDAVPTSRRRQLVIRHTSGDEPVAIIEVVSPANKRGREATDQFVDKAVSALLHGLHLQVLDLFPPGRSNRHGIHAAIWAELGGEYQPPADRLLTLASYVAASPARCYVEPSAVGSPLADLPLFLTRDRYVSVPLELTYMAAYRGMPKRWRDVIEARD